MWSILLVHYTLHLWSHTIALCEKLKSLFAENVTEVTEVHSCQKCHFKFVFESFIWFTSFQLIDSLSSKKIMIENEWFSQKTITWLQKTWFIAHKSWTTFIILFWWFCILFKAWKLEFPIHYKCRENILYAFLGRILILGRIISLILFT